MPEGNEEDKNKLMNFMFGQHKWLVILIVFFIIFVIIAGASIKDVIRINAVRNSNDPDSRFYRAFGPGAYADSVTIGGTGDTTSDDVNVDDAENTINFGMDVQDMWDNDSRYSEYLHTVAELEYLLNAQLVTQYPYIDGVDDDEFNGTIKFYRNDAEGNDYMKYVSQDTLQSYVDSYNSGDTSVLDDALNSFSLNSDGTIKIVYLTEAIYVVKTDDPDAASDAQEQISGSSTSKSSGNYVVSRSESTLSTTNVAYLSYVQNYVLPFNLLWSIVVMGQSDQDQAIELATSIADMAYEGEISLIIDDNTVKTVDTDTYTYTLTEHYDGQLHARIVKSTTTKTNTEGVVTESDPSVLVTWESSDEITDFTVDRENYTTVYTETHVTNSPSLKIRKIEAWCAIFENDATYKSTTPSNESNPNTSTLDDTEQEHVQTFTYSGASSISDVISAMSGGDGNPLKEWQQSLKSTYSNNTSPTTTNPDTGVETSISTTYTISYYSINDGIEETQNYTNINLSSTTSTTTSGYTNGTVTSPVFNEEIVEKFNALSVRSVRRTIVDTDDDGWFIPALEVNDDTANMVDLIKYIFNKADGEDVSDEDFASIWSNMYGDSSFDSVSSTSLMEFIRNYIRSWEGCTEISSDGTKYKIESDGYGHPTVGYGVDIENSGFKDRFTAAGYSTSIGSWVDVEFVDELEMEAIQSGYDAVVTETSGLNLTGYQIAALVSRYYNCGSSGWKRARNGKTFVQAYNAYWSDSKTEEYYEQSNNTSIYSEELYTNYMYLPNTSDGTYSRGLENRRKSEWLLFTTGYADRIDTQYSEGGGDIVSVATRIHAYISDNQYAYSCTHNVSAGYTNTCAARNESSVFGLALNAGTVERYYNIRCIDCSAFVSWVLYESGIDIGRQSSSFFYSGGYTSYTQYNWQKITNWNELQAGDILVRSRHVGIYIGDGYTLEAGSTNSIRATKTYGNLTSVQNAYSFAVRVTN